MTTPTTPAEPTGSLLDDLVKYFRGHAILPMGGAEALALYTIYTYVSQVFDIAPLLVIRSPMKQTGKTTVLNLLASVVANPVPAASASASSLFRRIAQGDVTLLLDEYDSFVHGNEELRNLFNAGHTRRFAYVLRSERKGDSWESKEFSTFCPKVLAGINRLAPTVEDRAVILCMRRKERSESIDPYTLTTLDADMEPMRQRLAAWGPAHADTLRGGMVERLATLSDRANDNWHPLLVIAESAGPEWYGRARDAAQSLSGVANEQGEIDEAALLLAHIREVFVQYPDVEFLETATILVGLNSRDDGPWGESGPSGKELTPHRLGSRLRGFGIHSKKIRAGADTQRGYRKADFADAWARYLP